MACTPPYCMGTGGWCNCNCNCCPPDPCYTQWTYVYGCGTKKDEWQAPDPNEGCDCPTSGGGFRAPGPPVEFPTFDLQALGLEDTVFALATGCSIPCNTATIILRTDGCCLVMNPDDTHFVAVGAGIITIDQPAGYCADANNPGDFGAFICKINGSETGAYIAEDCESLHIEISPPPGYECCYCCQLSSSGTPLNGFGGGMLPMVYRQTKVTSGVNKVFINKQRLVEKLRRKRR